MAQGLAHSVHDRLTTRARSEGRPYQEFLELYAMERFLYRLSRSAHASRFVLKGALLLRVWDAPSSRPTRDVDLLGRTDNSPENVASIVAELCALDVEPDALEFLASSIRATRIKEDAEYAGVRVLLDARLGRSKVALQLDVGFGDVMVPGAQRIEVPSLLGGPAAVLQGYPRASVVAEKFEAIVKLGTLNSRMKDFYDLWYLARRFDFDGAELARALAATFERRGTRIEAEPVGFAAAFCESRAAQTQWSAFVSRARLLHAPAELCRVTADLGTFLGPVARAAGESAAFPKRWIVPGPWRAS
jgi:hypothetical protein